LFVTRKEDLDLEKYADACSSLVGQPAVIQRFNELKVLEQYYATRIHLYIVDVHLPVVTKLERAFAFLLSKGICLIDFGVLRELTICFYL